MPETPAESMKPAGAGERRHHPCGQSGPLYTYSEVGLSLTQASQARGSLHHLQHGGGGRQGRGTWRP